MKTAGCSPRAARLQTGDNQPITCRAASPLAFTSSANRLIPRQLFPLINLSTPLPPPLRCRTPPYARTHLSRSQTGHEESSRSTHKTLAHLSPLRYAAARRRTPEPISTEAKPGMKRAHSPRIKHLCILSNIYIVLASRSSWCHLDKNHPSEN